MKYLLFTICVALMCGCDGGSDNPVTSTPPPPPTENPPPAGNTADIPSQLKMVESEVPTDAVCRVERDAQGHVYWSVKWEGLRGTEARQWNDPTIPKWPWTVGWSRMLAPVGHEMRAAATTYDPITKVLSCPGFCKIQLLTGPG